MFCLSDIWSCLFCCLHGFLPTTCLSAQDDLMILSKADLRTFIFSHASRVVCFPGIQTLFVCNLVGPHQSPSNRATFEDCNSSVDDNLLRIPHESSIFLSSRFGAEAPITKEMTRDFNNFTRTSFEPPQNIEGRYFLSLNNTLYSNSAFQIYIFFKVRLEPLTGRCQPPQLVALFGRSGTRYCHSWVSTEKTNVNQKSQPMLTSSSNPQDTASAYSLKGFKLPYILSIEIRWKCS